MIGSLWHQDQIALFVEIKRGSNLEPGMSRSLYPLDQRFIALKGNNLRMVLNSVLANQWLVRTLQKLKKACGLQPRQKTENQSLLGQEKRVHKNHITEVHNCRLHS